MLRVFLFAMLLFSFAYTKECFKDKSVNKFICYEKYFNKNKIYNSKFGEKYYTSNSGKIYSFSDKIEIQFYAVGAIINILKDFEVDFYDKTKGETYILKVKNPNELFAITSNLNALTAVKKAHPVRKRRFTKEEINARAVASKARRDKAKARIKGIKTTSKKKKSSFKGNFLDPSKNKKAEAKNFLRGGV